MSVVQQPIRRDPAHGWVAGVFAGLGDRLGVDPLILRVGFVVLAVATGGLALVAYVVAWAALPAAEGKPAPLARFARVPRLRGDWRGGPRGGPLPPPGLLPLPPPRGLGGGAGGLS